MADDGFASFYASSYRRLLGQLFAVTGDLPEAWVRRVAINLAAMAARRWSGPSARRSPTRPAAPRAAWTGSRR